MTILLCTLALLLLATRAAYRLVRADEAAPVKADPREAFYAAMDRSMTDSHRCEQCREVVPIREIVTLYDGAALVCVPCAELYRVRRVE
ncbi:hypothetical protein [Gemmatimonas sp.]|uniref:hypothetical protein n=1 Tax=Gemmatimonas sp. TaxID=1962908 RepID=UPI00333EB83C